MQTVLLHCMCYVLYMYYTVLIRTYAKYQDIHVEKHVLILYVCLFYNDKLDMNNINNTIKPQLPKRANFE